MIGYYVHHVGHGHLHRARSVAAALGDDVTGLSSLAAPAGWPGEWVRLDPDDAEPHDDVTAGGRLHWAPVHHEGLRSRMSVVSSWLAAHRPRAFVVDVSVEVAALVRLHGVPVVTVVGPGERGDAAHRLGFDLSDALVGCWPDDAAGMLRGLPPQLLGRVQRVGAVSRFAPTSSQPRRPGALRITVLSGTGGRAVGLDELSAAQQQTPEWEWRILDPAAGTWVQDPFPVLCDSDVVVTHAGQNALAEVAASRTPALVVPQERPHEEQVTTADVLRRGDWPALVVADWSSDGWAERLSRAAALDGQDWADWCDGRAADRIADVVRAVASGARL